VRDRAATFDRLGDAVGVVGVDAVVALDEDDFGADAFGLADLRSGLDAEGLGLVGGGDAAGGVGQGGTTARGRERNSGWSCCSTEAKKLLRSMWRKAKRSV